MDILSGELYEKSYSYAINIREKKYENIKYIWEIKQAPISFKDCASV